MSELSLFCFSAIFITKALTKKLLATRRPASGFPASRSPQGGDEYCGAKNRSLTSQDGHSHVADSHWPPVTRASKGGATGKTHTEEPENKTFTIPDVTAGGRDLAAR